ncbi:hypothetical protein [Coxiella burnetii]|nr:hypothetical protein [Coxiella burnetii]ATN75085.1 hypothetical protein AYM90_08975 [Coxiella burnetii]ATN76993.1 hypothetical protein AYM94_08990 [Coxiella burnetii]ATN78910.1 hypothetical protein AYM93_08985 [Coxiella burnetii]ATN80816.1 hypothetical protein AYN00_08960 [Coxiella burnetii]OYK89427.1 hypothetical protein CbuQ195_09220 [Coxiella burnetii]
MKCMAQEILENLLSITATKKNIRRLTAHLIIFEKELQQRTEK